MTILEVFLLKLSREKSQQYTQKTSEFPVDFHRQFVEAFPQLTGMDPEAVQKSRTNMEPSP